MSFQWLSTTKQIVVDKKTLKITELLVEIFFIVFKKKFVQPIPYIYFLVNKRWIPSKQL